MIKKIGWFAAVGVVAFACGEAGQSMSNGAGAMDGGGATDGSGAVPGSGNGGATGGTPEQNVSVTCDKSATRRFSDDRTYTHYWTEFDVDPGATEVTVCRLAILGDGFRSPPSERDNCSRSKAQWYEGTNTGFFYCGAAIDYDNPDIPDAQYQAPLSVTVHR